MTQVIQVSLDEAGNILIPAPLQERLHLSPGMTLVVEEDEEGRLRLRIQSRSTNLVEKEGVLVARVTALGDLEKATRHERDRRVADQKDFRRVYPALADKIVAP